MRNPVIVMTTYKGPEAFTAAALANLLAQWGRIQTRGGGYEVGEIPPGPAAGPIDLVVARGTDPSAQLHRAVRDLRERGAPGSTSGVLSLEHDHYFEPQDLHDLLTVSYDFPDAIVGGLYYQRQSDALVGEILKPIPEWEEQPTPAYLCGNVGLGFTFIPWSVFEKISEPWFDPRWIKGREDGKWTRESHDQAFCRHARVHDIPIIGVILKTLTHAHEVQPRGVAFKKEQKA